MPQMRQTTGVACIGAKFVLSSSLKVGRHVKSTTCLSLVPPSVTPTWTQQRTKPSTIHHLPLIPMLIPIYNMCNISHVCVGGTSLKAYRATTSTLQSSDGRSTPTTLALVAPPVLNNI